MWPPTANKLQGLSVVVAAHLLNRLNIREYRWIQEAIGEVWIDLEQNVIDTAIKEWRKGMW